MRLVWHIAKKDLRRMALPVGLWLLFIVGMAIWFRGITVPVDVLRTEAIQPWTNSMMVLSVLIGLVQAVAGVLLAGAMVLEDVVGGTRSHWQTKPIAGLRLLAGKVLGATLLLVLAPVAVLTPVWLASGFSWAEWAGAAGEFAGWQMVMTLLAMGFAALAKNLGQFIFTTVFWGLAYGFAGSRWLRDLFLPRGDTGTGMSLTAQALIMILPLAVMVVVLLRHYWTRQAARGWVFLIGLIPLALLIRLVWVWDFTPGDKKPDGTLAHTRLVIEKWVQPEIGYPDEMVFRVTDGMKHETLIGPWSGRIATPWWEPIWPASEWGMETARAMVENKPVRMDPKWVMKMPSIYHPETRKHGGAAEPRLITGEMTIAAIRPYIVCEIPLRMGAEMRAGSILTRIAYVGPMTAYRGPGVVIEEREYWNKLGPGLRLSQPSIARRERSTDCFLLVNRRLGLVQPLNVDDQGAAGLSSIGFYARSLNLGRPAPLVNESHGTSADWANGAVLVKVRFEREESWSTGFSATLAPVEMEETNP